MLIELAIAFQSFTIPNYAQSWSCFVPRYFDKASQFTTPWFVPRAIFRGNELLFIAPDHAPIQIFITSPGVEFQGRRTLSVIIRRVAKGDYRVLAPSTGAISANIPIEPARLEGFSMSLCDCFHQNSTPPQVRRMVWFFFATDMTFATNNRGGWSHCAQNASDFPNCHAETNLQYWMSHMSSDSIAFLHETGPASVYDSK